MGDNPRNLMYTYFGESSPANFCSQEGGLCMSTYNLDFNQTVTEGTHLF